MSVVTPRCAAAAVVSAVVLRRPTKEYTPRYSMMHRRLTTAGIEVAPHYHQLLVQLFRQRPSTSKSICTQTYSKQRGVTVNGCYVAHTCALCAYQILCRIGIKVGPRLCAEPTGIKTILCNFSFMPVVFEGHYPA